MNLEEHAYIGLKSPFQVLSPKESCRLTGSFSKNITRVCLCQCLICFLPHSPRWAEMSLLKRESQTSQEVVRGWCRPRPEQLLTGERAFPASACGQCCSSSAQPAPARSLSWAHTTHVPGKQAIAERMEPQSKQPDVCLVGAVGEGWLSCPWRPCLTPNSQAHPRVSWLQKGRLIEL